MVVIVVVVCGGVVRLCGCAVPPPTYELMSSLITFWKGAHARLTRPSLSTRSKRNTLITRSELRFTALSRITSETLESTTEVCQAEIRLRRGKSCVRVDTLAPTEFGAWG